MDPALVDEVIGRFEAAEVDYFSNTTPPTYPDGLDIEVFTRGALERAARETTEPYDRGSKWQQYQLIPSLQEYVLISQGEPRIEIYRRLPSGAWEYTDVTTGTVALTGGAAIDLARLYDDLPA